MIWYLLFPRRGTTEPPILPPLHPVRRAFHHHGLTVARHWLACILLSVAAAVVLCYPAILLYDKPQVGMSTVPQRLWASFKFLGRGYDYGPKPDAEMRQIWVHGDYMKALERDVLMAGLEIQDLLIGRGFCKDAQRSATHPMYQVDDPESDEIGAVCDPPSEDMTWLLHSPLMYWNCSSAQLEADNNLLHTINAQTHRATPFNFTLKTTSVFAGKSFSINRLVAADALVISFYDLLRCDTEKQWDERVEALKQKAENRWQLYPSDGKMKESNLYEYGAEPMSLQDDIFLAIAYGCMAIYVLVGLRKLKAVKSTVGLIVTVLSETAIAILGSFTICGVLKINLSPVPRVMYPFVVLVIGLENMFRIVNTVIATPPEMPPTVRIATAVGDVGHLTLGAAGANMIVLWVLSKVVSDDLVACCTFAQIAIVIDFLFHNTFFVAVLSVDVRRMELEDFLEGASAPGHERKPSRSERQSWFSALLQGRLPFTTRMAGSLVSICFILLLNQHFLDDKSRTWSFISFLRSFRASHRMDADELALSPPPINSARSLQTWLRMQDSGTTEQLAHHLRPHQHTFVLRVYEPITVVLNGSDRSSAPSYTASIFRRFGDVVEEHFFPFAITFIFTLAIVTLLLNYLLFNEISEDEVDAAEKAEPVLSVKTAPKSHSLDVIRISGSNKGHFVSVSLDRLTSVYILDPHANAYTKKRLQQVNSLPLWPVTAMAFDESSTSLALCAAKDTLAIFSLPDCGLKRVFKLDLFGQMPILFSIVTVYNNGAKTLSVLSVTSDGQLQTTDFSLAPRTEAIQISDAPLSSASLIFGDESEPEIITLGKDGDIRISSYNSGSWTTDLYDPQLKKGREGLERFPKIKHIKAVSPLGLLIIVKYRSIAIVDSQLRVLHSFETDPISYNSVRAIHSPRRTCSSCGSIAVRSLSVVYNGSNVQECIMRTFTAEEKPSSLICLRYRPANGQRDCKSFEQAIEAVNTVYKPGVWESTGTQAIVGIRTPPIASDPVLASFAMRQAAPSFSTSQGARTPTALARRAHKSQSSDNLRAASENEAWEAWTLSSNGEFHTVPLNPPKRRGSLATDICNNEEDDDNLFVSRPGPITRLGNHSVAVGFGNAIKIITVGHEHFSDSPPAYQFVAARGGSWTRRTSSRKTQ